MDLAIFIFLLGIFQARNWTLASGGERHFLWIQPLEFFKFRICVRGHNCWLNFRDSVWSSCLSHVHKRFSKTVSFVQKSLFSDSTVHAHYKSVTECRFSIQLFSTFPPSPDHSETSFGTLSSRPKRCRTVPLGDRKSPHDARAARPRGFP